MVETLAGLLAVSTIYLFLRLRRARRGSGRAPVHPPLEIFDLAARLQGPYENSAQPGDLLELPQFQRGVTIFQSSAYTSKDLIGYYIGDNAVIACMALAALERRSASSDIDTPIIAHIGSVAPWVRYFALRVLSAHVPPERPMVGRLLLTTDTAWTMRICLQMLAEFVDERAEAGETFTFGAELDSISEGQADFIHNLLVRLGESRTQGLRTELQTWLESRVDVTFLDSIGRVWHPGDVEQGEILSHESLRESVDQLERTLTHESAHSVLLVGESGVGKTTIVRALGERLLRSGWTIFEAGEAELLAGQSHIGMLEERLQKLLRCVGGRRRVIWFVPEFHRLLWAGRHQYSPTGILDILLSHMEQSGIRIVGETQPLAYERLAVLSPSCVTAFETHRVAPLGQRETLELARAWIQRHSLSPEQQLLTEATLLEAWNLVQQYRSDRFLPGLLLDFLEVTRKRLAQAGSPSFPIQVHDFIATLTQLTGLPTSILDERQSLDLAGLQRLFEKRILGQPEAIRCLVERVAMIKAGVTDPSRPQGVFLFAGPTGTGKTEIAKTLAEFLFGSASRMIRIDMSELQTRESLSRLLGGSEGPSQGALVDLVRRQPFSVVLLDEFEKAHPNVWDLFLQVFDDGRLTDRQGNTTDFRSAIIIMTTNLGGLIPSGASVGFTPQGGRFRPENVHRAIDESFRRELLNRIDRVVVFRPLSREVMRDILRKQLDEVTRRRGLRNREWAIEWSEDAIEFLLDRGFTPDLGARPLKRAIERYFLSQLATTIVRHEYPKGDQFLFVRAEEDGLVVQFVDPDAPMEPAPAPAELAADPGTLRLERIALEPCGGPEEVVLLQREFDRIQSCVATPVWQAQKLELLGRMRDSEFWHSAERFTVLDRAEYLDRVERGTKSAGSLLERLRGSRSDGRSHYPRDLVARLAQQLYLLDAACRGIAAGQPHDAFLLVEAARDIGPAADPNRAFALQIGAMYRAWAAKRRMQLDVMEESGGEGRDPYRLLLAISGYAAYSILHPEDGLHVLEEPVERDSSMRRSRVRVRIAAQPDRPLDSSPAARARLAAQAFEASSGVTPAVVRRYREQPTPLVRDAIRGWRSGKLEKILGGDFDLIGDEIRTTAS